MRGAEFTVLLLTVVPVSCVCALSLYTAYALGSARWGWDGTRGEAGIANSRFHRNVASRVSTESGMGRRPKTFGIGFGFATCPHQKLEKVTDVTVV